MDDTIHKAYVETGYWIDLDSGEISRTENIRPYRSAKHIKSEDSAFGVYHIPVLYRYPGGMNRRIRWETMEHSDLEDKNYEEILNKAESAIGEAVKKAKNELKNTLSEQVCAMLLPFDSIKFAAEDGHGVLLYQGESIGLRANKNYPEVCNILHFEPEKVLENGALLGELFYDAETRRIYICPISIVTKEEIIRLC